MDAPDPFALPSALALRVDCMKIGVLGRGQVGITIGNPLVSGTMALDAGQVDTMIANLKKARADSLGLEVPAHELIVPNGRSG